MSDEIEVVSQRAQSYGFALAGSHVAASKATFAVRSAQVSLDMMRNVPFLLPFGIFALAVLELWMASHGGNWGVFWFATIGAAISAVYVGFIFGQIYARINAESRTFFEIHRGIQALRQAAASADHRLAPVRELALPTGSSEPAATGSPSDVAHIGPLHRPEKDSNGIALIIIGLFLLAFVAIFIFLIGNMNFLEDESLRKLLIVFVGVMAIAVVLYLVMGFQFLRKFTITANGQGFKWQRPVFNMWRRAARMQWQDVRAFITFMASKDGKSSEVDEIFLLDTTNEALAWRITPKTPTSVREAHERFVRMANEHVPLRDITASLKDLLASPETRSYEYSVIALSGAAPVPPSVRKVLTTPVRESHFLRGYLIVAAILLALLVVAGLLLQFGILPAGTF